MSAADANFHSENPYAAPATTDLGLPTAGPDDPEAQELAAFVGSKANYYLAAWLPQRQSSGGGRRFNWAAFFLAGIWMAYRKMYKYSLIFFGAVLLESVIEELVVTYVFRLDELPRGLELGIQLAIGILCGTLGNSWYLSHARKTIARVRLEQPEQQARLLELNRRGGTSFLGAIGMFLAFLLIAGVLTVILVVLEEGFTIAAD